MMDEIFSTLNRRLDANGVAGVPKHVRLREAIFSTIREGVLKPGDQIAPEQLLARETGLSLGTVRKALSDLATDGVLIREHGRGTFVSYSNPSTEDLWQLKFVESPAGAPLPLSFILKEKKNVTNEGPWLGQVDGSGGGVFEFTRQLVVNGHFVCGSKFYVSTIRFPEISKIPRRELNLNFKQLLSNKFGVHTHSVDQFAQISVFTDEVCDLIGAAPHTQGLIVHSLGRDNYRQIISYQMLAIPHGPYLLASQVSRNV